MAQNHQLQLHKGLLDALCFAARLQLQLHEIFLCELSRKEFRGPWYRNSLFVRVSQSVGKRCKVSQIVEKYCKSFNMTFLFQYDMFDAL